MSTKSKVSVEYKYWIIISEKRNAIWKDVYLSYEEAKDELIKQEQIAVAQGKPLSSMDWKIEERTAYKVISKEDADFEKDYQQ